MNFNPLLFSPFQPKSTNKYQQPCRRDPDTTARATTTIPLVERIRRLVRAITVSFSFVLLDLVVRAVMFLAPKGMNLQSQFVDTRSTNIQLLCSGRGPSLIIQWCCNTFPRCVPSKICFCRSVVSRRFCAPLPFLFLIIGSSLNCTTRFLHANE